MSARNVLATWCLLACGVGCQQEAIVYEADAAKAVARAYCGQLFACLCTSSAEFSSEEACLATVEEDLYEQQVEAVDSALLYDEDCVQRSIDRIHAEECTRNPEDLALCSDCFAYHGLLPENAGCERIGAFSNCDQGLACVAQMDEDGDTDDVCVPACLRVGLGGVCEGDQPGFDPLYACEDGLVCDDETGRCGALPGPGIACFVGGLCAPDAWCDSANDPPICAAMKGNGEGCDADTECDSGWCRDGERCRVPLAAGKSCEAGDDRCAIGLQCSDDSETCVPSDALVCEAPRSSF